MEDFDFEMDLEGATQSNDSYVDDRQESTSKEFVRELGDNYLFKDIQVEDIETLIRPETIFFWDFDTPVYRIASNMEVTRLRVKCLVDEKIHADVKNITEFKGRGKTVSESSWLGVLNIERELEGKEPLSVEDFETEQYQMLNTDEDKAFETAKIQVYKVLKEMRLQYKLPKIVPLLGEGSSFREGLPTCRLYKGNRVETLRPLLLKRLRQWMVDEVGAIMTTEQRNGYVIECDDKVEFYASLGYQHYRKTGWFNYGVISSDKDSLNSAKLVINPDRHRKDDGQDGGKLKFPKPMLIEASDRDAGDMVLIPKGNKKDVKGYGFKFLMYQAFLGKDSADHYDALSHLGQGLDFGDISAYKALKPCETAKESLQAAIDVFAKLLPYGVQYTDHTGVEKDVPTLEYMNTYFQVAYMLRHETDEMDLYKLCKLMKVDTSAIEDNNKLTPPVRTYIGNQEVSEDILKELQELLSGELKSYKSLKKDLLIEKLDKVKEVIETQIPRFEESYEFQQFEK